MVSNPFGHKCRQYKNLPIGYYCTPRVSRYIQYNDENHFDTIQLKCVVEDDENMKCTYGKLTAPVVYNPNYFHPNSTNRIQI